MEGQGSEYYSTRNWYNFLKFFFKTGARTFSTRRKQMDAAGSGVWTLRCG